MTTVKTRPEPATPVQDQLAEGDLAYHTYLLSQLETVPRLVEAVKRIEGARDLWLAYLEQKHQLGQGDQVDRDGRIARASGVGAAQNGPERPRNGLPPLAVSQVTEG